ncbi:hypothetical protein NKR23_g8435 [Pleurostoma richardsiae]|uniref:Zn(2)-C6 fungal-type domain-containing protein n=1 Tax=Pleurostoma richardsiae TaxID=41990 RepID=A0AA38VLI8_9PEZI|nr:hypothetical protein NKR23_g8435 [Pleurostoma richardsiae]
MAGARAAHSKSRAGCKQCKKRRVKCGLQEPRCAHCVRRDEQCEYPSFGTHPAPAAPAAASASSPGARAPSLPSSPHSPTSRRHRPRSLTSPSVPASLHPGYPPWDSSQFLTAMPGMSPSLSPSEARVWAAELPPDLAERHPFLLHNGLALAALRRHHARAPDAADCYAAACAHQLAASRLFRGGVQSVTRGNWLACFIFSVSLTVFHFHVSCRPPSASAAGERGQGGGEHPVSFAAPASEPHDFLESFFVLRHSSYLARQLLLWFRRSPLLAVVHRRLGREWAMLQEAQRLEDEEGSGGAKAAVKRLAEAVDRLPMGSGGGVARKDRCEEGEEEEHWRTTCRVAVNSLRRWVRSVSGAPRSWADFLWWPVMQEAEYVALLEARVPAAVVIYAHWCAVMDRAPVRWYLEGWAQRTVAAAVEGAELGPQWAALMAWPLRTIGMTEDEVELLSEDEAGREQKEKVVLPRQPARKRIADLQEYTDAGRFITELAEEEETPRSLRASPSEAAARSPGSVQTLELRPAPDDAPRLPWLMISDLQSPGDTPTP